MRDRIVTIRKLEPVPDAAALVAQDILVVADLHIGKEEELRRAGFTLPSQAQRMAEEVWRLGSETGCTGLVILGDLKHQVPRSTGLERREVPRFFDLLEGVFEEVHLVQGNHDGGISYILPRWVRLHGPEGFRMGEIGYVHGHAWPSPEVMGAQVLLMGHNHPTILFPDRLGFRNIERCWLRSPVKGSLPAYERLPKEVIVQPAFNEFSGGTTVNETGSRLLGPILNSGVVDVDEARVYLLDGVYLGKLRDMMVAGRGQTVEESP